MNHGRRYLYLCIAGLGLILGSGALFLRRSLPVEPVVSVDSRTEAASLSEPLVLAAGEVERSAAKLVEEPPPEVTESPRRMNADPQSPRPQLRIRLLRPDRSPIVDADVEITREENRLGRGTSIGSRARTDGFGVLRFDWTEFLAGSIRSVTFRAPAGMPEHFGSIELSRVLALDDDLGELVLNAVPLVATGIVIDEFGRGVPDAEVYVVARTGGFGSPLAWFKHERTVRHTAPDGTFRMVADELWGDAYELEALHAKIGVSERVQFQVGATGIELRLLRCASVTGSIVMPSGLPPAMLTASLLTPDEFPGGFSNPLRSTRIDDTGRFELRDILPGTYRFVLTGNHPRTLLTIPDVVVTRPPFSQDPRLQDIPLESHLKPVRVEVVDASDRPIEASLMVRERGFESSVGGYRVDRGVFVVPDLPSGQDLLISAPGFQPVWRKDVRADSGSTLRIALAPSMRRTFVFEGEFPVRASGRRLAILLMPSPALIEARSESVIGVENLRAECGSERSVELAIPYPGEYSLSIVVRDGEGILVNDQTIETRQIVIDDAPSGTIPIAESPALRAALDG